MYVVWPWHSAHECVHLVWPSNVSIVHSQRLVTSVERPPLESSEHDFLSISPCSVAVKNSQGESAERASTVQSQPVGGSPLRFKSPNLVHVFVFVVLRPHSVDGHCAAFPRRTTPRLPFIAKITFKRCKAPSRPSDFVLRYCHRYHCGSLPPQPLRWRHCLRSLSLSHWATGQHHPTWRSSRWY
jgi:hypothetical protein